MVTACKTARGAQPVLLAPSPGHRHPSAGGCTVMWSCLVWFREDSGAMDGSCNSLSWRRDRLRCPLQTPPVPTCRNNKEATSGPWDWPVCWHPAALCRARWLQHKRTLGYHVQTTPPQGVQPPMTAVANLPCSRAPSLLACMLPLTVPFHNINPLGTLIFGFSSALWQNFTSPQLCFQAPLFHAFCGPKVCIRIFRGPSSQDHPGCGDPQPCPHGWCTLW